MKFCLIRDRGTGLIEALITFLVVSLGLLTVSRVERELRLTGETARQRSEAVRLAQEDIEQLRSFTRIEAFATGRSYADIVTSAYRIDAASGYASNTVYRVDRQVSPAGVASARNVSVSVAWSDRAGEPQSVRLESVLAANDPALSGALGLAPAHPAVNGPMARAIQIPRTALDLRTGRSAFSLAEGAARVFLFDNDSGVIVERCERTAAGSAGAPGADLAACARVTAYLLSGVIRLPPAAVSSPSPSAPPASVTLDQGRSSRAAAPECASTLAAATDAGDRYLQYACVVYAGPTGPWSGETHLATNGSPLGPRPPDYRACPSGAETEGQHALASHDLRPGTVDVGSLAVYTDVPGSLANQNFRLIAANQRCPS